jgi:uncharacterized cupin superfamily protein
VPYKRNLEETEWVDMSHGERFFHRRKTLTPMDQSQMPKFGLSLYRLEPGKRAFPFHEHTANDEGLLITRGSGTLRYGDEEISLIEGDYVHLPAASGKAHQVVNNSDASLEYFCFSSMQLPEVVHYPDSNKLGAITPGDAVAGKASLRKAAFLIREPVGYWEGEAPE